MIPSFEIFMKTKLALLSAALAASLVAAPAFAKTFKWSSASDIPTLDIHSQNNALGNGVHASVYESLVYYNSRPSSLSRSWPPLARHVSPTQIRFTLRPGVKFSDGSPLTADDVVFSIMRAMAKTSNYAVYTQGIDKAVKVNDNTVDLIMKGPNPVLLNQLTELRIMSKAWAEKNKSVEPKDIKTKDESFAHRNAMGTGPFMVKEWQPDQKLVLVKNPLWWGNNALAT
jgi:peptide/nickel transport system substrate-binding protein